MKTEKIKSVFVLDAGKGYKFKPTVTINTTTGSGAVIELSIDVNGSVSNAVVREQGSNYKSIDTITVRDFSALVKTQYGYRQMGSLLLHNRGVDTY